MASPQLFLHIPFLILLPLVFPPATLSDLTSDRDALLRLRASVRGQTTRWNTTSPSPCSWKGVTCSSTSTNRVIELRLPGSSLSGELPPDALGNLTALRVLSLRANSLTGPIPDNIASCTELTSLILENNAFSGQLPTGFFQLRNLSRVSLAGNNFSGEISPWFGNLSSLRVLYLENNQFSGTIEWLSSLRHLRNLNVSFNNLTGSIPSNLNGFLAESFLGNSVCGAPLPPCPGGGGGDGNNLSTGAIAGIVVGSVVGSVVILFILISKCGTKRKTNPVRPLPPPSPLKQPERGGTTRMTMSSDEESQMSPAREEFATTRMRTPPVNDGLLFFDSNNYVFSLESLLRASAEVLGRGSLGTTYRAYLEGGNEVVVKRLKSVSAPERQFREVVENLGKFDHENLVPLKAYFYNREEKLVVFESMPMPSLDALLHGSKGEERAILTWTTRVKIALGAACGIEYLHSRGPGVAHGNIKPSNILVKNYYDVCLIDYGLIQLVSSGSPSYQDTYRAPEVTGSNGISQKGDVYSFGVVLLELLTGKSPVNALRTEGFSLPTWARSHAENRTVVEVFSPELMPLGEPDEEMVRLLELSLDCTSEDPKNRPLMMEVVKFIKETSNY